MLDAERAESDDGYLLPLFERRRNSIDDRINSATSISLRKVGIGRDCFDEFRFVHSYPLRIKN